MGDKIIKFFGVIVVTLVCALGVLAVLQLIVNIAGAVGVEEGPAWVQAIGSIIAILIAVLIAAHQHSAQTRRDEESAHRAVQALLKIIRVEVEVLFEISERNVGSALESSPPGTPFLSIFPVTEHPFTIFDAVAPRLGEVSDEVLRRNIIRGFSIAKSYIATFRFHNELVEEYDRLSLIGNFDPESPEAQIIPGKLAVLTAYSDTLRGWHQEVKRQIEILLEVLPR